MDLREAAQQALEALEHVDGYNGWVDVSEEITALRAALAEATTQESRQVEPVAWMWKYRRLDGSVVRVTTYRNQHPPKELDFILKNLGEDAIPLYAENPPRNIHPKTGVTACLMQSPEFRLTPWSEK